jgi:hypothetical protein
MEAQMTVNATLARQLFISSSMEFLILTVIPKYFNFVTFSNEV